MTAFFQSLVPQTLISQLMGKLAESTNPWIKNKLIHSFIKHYPIDLSEAVRENPEDYRCFNDFFIRQLKPHLRPISRDTSEIASPVDGTIAQIGEAKANQLLQAKNFYFDLETLLGGDAALAKYFYDAKFATLYLAPFNYHRVHMPLTGTLIKNIYVPGKLFSVNRMTSELVPHLYSRNERLITLFETEAGQMAVILVGAMMVGSIQTAWLKTPVRANKIYSPAFTPGFKLEKGDELGHFKMGSTVILLFANNQVKWGPALKSDISIKFGQSMGVLEKS